jgi:hypothetical protein
VTLRERGPAAQVDFNERFRSHPLGNLHAFLASTRGGSGRRKEEYLPAQELDKYADSVGRRAIDNATSGTTIMAPTLAPVSAIATARPWCFSNHGAIVALRPVTDIVA